MKILCALLLALICAPVLAQTYTPGVQVASVPAIVTSSAPVNFVAPSAATLVMVCNTAPPVSWSPNTCWPTEVNKAGNSTISAALGSLAPSATVFAIVPPATIPQWATVASITANAAPGPPAPPITAPAVAVPIVVSYLCAPGSIAPTMASALVPGGIQYTFTSSCLPPP